MKEKANKSMEIIKIPEIDQHRYSPLIFDKINKQTTKAMQ